jgi:hypothetical protein
MIDLTVYLIGPSERELELLIQLYESICPADRLVNYKIDEFDYWVPLAQPELTATGRLAAMAGIKRPHLEPVRRRIADGRTFELQLWDGRAIDDSEGSWSFTCRRIHRRSTGLHAFTRLLIPLHADLHILSKAAIDIATSVRFYSGHGGLVFVYNPWFKEDAFDAIYARARRFWGIDVEDLNDTLPLMNKGIKGVNWVTLLGRCFALKAEIQSSLRLLQNTPDVTVTHLQHGIVLVAGGEPVVGDRNRPDHSLNPYYAVAKVLKPLFLHVHPDFPSERFIKNGNTLGWIRRFIEPAGWS